MIVDLTLAMLTGVASYFYTQLVGSWVLGD